MGLAIFKGEVWASNYVMQKQELRKIQRTMGFINSEDNVWAQ